VNFAKSFLIWLLVISCLIFWVVVVTAGDMTGADNQDDRLQPAAPVQSGPANQETPGVALSSPDQGEIHWAVVASGGAQSSLGGYLLKGTVGQSCAGRVSLGGRSLIVGFWQDFSGDVVGVDDNQHDELFPNKFGLSQNYPNPFNPATTIEYTLPSRCHVTISVYNLLGQKISIIVDEVKPLGTYRAIWDGRKQNGEEAASGIYLYRIQAGNFVESKKMVLLK
jgi:hypothetical protein